MDVYGLLLCYYSAYARPSNRDGICLNASTYKQEFYVSGQFEFKCCMC